MAVSKNRNHEHKQDIMNDDDAQFAKMGSGSSKEVEARTIAADSGAVHDKNPESDNLVHQRASSSRRYRNSVPSSINRPSGDVPRPQEGGSTWHRTIMTAVLVLWYLEFPLAVLGNAVELVGNISAANGGLFRSIWRLYLTALCLFQKWFLIIPAKDSVDYNSIIGLIDPRTALFKEQDTSGDASSIEDDKDSSKGTGPTLSSVISSPFPEADHGSRSTADVMVMAAKLAYENEAVCRKVVTKDWEMHFVKFFNCWNAYQKRWNTQVFLFTDKPENAKAIVIAWRGTEPFNAYDWSTDIDVTLQPIRGLGRVHTGFLEALGLVDRSMPLSFSKLQNKSSNRLATPRPHDVGAVGSAANSSSASRTKNDGAGANSSPSLSMSGLQDSVIMDQAKCLAYDVVSATVRELLDCNPEAKIYITGHSLGGALAALYTAMLVHNEEDDLVSRIASVYTFGQPRVGDDAMARAMKEKLKLSDISIVTGLTFDRDGATATAAAMDGAVGAGAASEGGIGEGGDGDGVAGELDVTAETAGQAIGFYRVVYCNDLVPRVPFDDNIFNFEHWGLCFYFNSLFKNQTIVEVPNKNFFLIKDILVMHLNAGWELFHTLFLEQRYGPEFQETSASILYRFVGLFLPGVGGHSPVNYVNAMRLGNPSPLVVKVSEARRIDRADLLEAWELIRSDLSRLGTYVESKVGFPLGISGKTY